jgi:predicted SAM-dependent methyltransferase
MAKQKIKTTAGWVNPGKNVQGISLDLGAGNPDEGENQTPNFVLQDIQPHRNIDLVCDIRDIKKYISEGQCREIKMSHILEHFGTKEVKDVIRMIHGLLEENGKFTIFVPNFQWHAELAKTGSDEMAVHYAFGGQTDEYDYHKTGFTPKILWKYLNELGFKVVSMDEGTSIECHAVKV